MQEGILADPIIQSPAMEPAPRRTRPCGVAEAEAAETGRTRRGSASDSSTDLDPFKARKGTLRNKVPVLLCSIALPHLKGVSMHLYPSVCTTCLSQVESNPCPLSSPGLR